MAQNDKGGLFVKFPLDEAYVDALQRWKSDFEQKGKLISLREILEREIIKLDRTAGISATLRLEQAPIILDAPTNSQRIPVRLKDEAVIESITSAATLSNRSISKVLYTLVRLILDDSAFAPFQTENSRKTG